VLNAAVDRNDARHGSEGGLPAEEAAALLKVASDAERDWSDPEVLAATAEQQGFGEGAPTLGTDPCFEALIDHPSVIEKVRALFGDTFILHSSWNTMVPGTDATGVHPDPNPKTGFHQDGTGSYDFKLLGSNNGLGGTGGPTPLVQLRIGFVMTDLSEPGAGQLAVIPGSHNAKMALPSGFTEDPELMTIAVEVNAKPGTAILFHQGVYHTSTPNYRPYNRYIQHMIYSGPWLVRSGRTGSDPKWLEQTTERRRLLMGDFENGSYKRFHGPGPIPKL